LGAAPVALDAAHMPAVVAAEPSLREFDEADKPPCDTPLPPESTPKPVTEKSDCGGLPCPDEPAIKMWDVPVKKPPPPSPAPTIDDYATTKAEFAARYDAAPPQVLPTAAPSPAPSAAPTATPTLAPCVGPDCADEAAFAAVWETAPSPHPTSAPSSPTSAPTGAPTSVPTGSPTAVHYHDGKTAQR
jgi:hypothetical protein